MISKGKLTVVVTFIVKFLVPGVVKPVTVLVTGNVAPPLKTIGVPLAVTELIVYPTLPFKVNTEVSHKGHSVVVDVVLLVDVLVDVLVEVDVLVLVDVEVLVEVDVVVGAAVVVVVH
jgi:hypothetical protein